MSIVKKGIYYCSICGNIVESLWDGKPSIVCCGQDMEQLSPKTVDAGNEKHVPVVERSGNQVTVKVGDVDHPMTAEHYILFIEVLAGDKVYRHDFTEAYVSGETPRAVATFTIEDEIQEVREFCNKHGLWATQF
ncbi:desulfoferrodoxin family protein [Chitinivibrio alkaliphilus]|uniref:Desulfoferrodoxin n=1 Tax=Chitinivibrio alkaliphilus ACht1 TaxID=1313304 RepID=U7D723_9BACT|nr:desulfoferrodoxin family protein [Chitinivibrio alkaliphilus]ERP31346.1 desulfoferrodoxin [Chitinivibrio alkaliphilus ACht1]